MKSIKYKILLGFSIILVLMLILSTYVLINIKTFNKEVEQVVTRDLELLIADKDLEINMSQGISLARGYVLFGYQTYKDMFNSYTEESKITQDKVLSLNNSDEVKSLIEQSNQWRELIQEEVFAEYDKGNKEVALQALQEKGTGTASQIMAGFNKSARDREEFIQANSLKLIENGKSLDRVTTIITILCIILGIIIAVVISNIIIKPIIQIVSRVKLIAAGDLSGEEIKIKSKDEIATLTQSVNEMVINLRDLVKEVQETSDQVAATSEELTASAEQSSHASEEITSNIQQLAIGSENQTKQVEGAIDIINEMVASVEQVSSNAENVASTVEITDMKTKEGSLAIDTSINQMNEISETVQNLSHVIKGLDSQSKEIGEIVTVIGGIADQTNLLALNAAIEAARAGEYGKGFAVVADEVRKLAEESAKSSNKISQLVTRIQEETTNAIYSMDSTIKEVDNGIVTAKTAGNSFLHIKEAINEVTSQVKDVSISMSEMAAGTEHVLRSIHAVSSIAEESAAGTQNVSASSEEQLASTEEITASAYNLSKMAENLSTQISKFKI
ncbi:methyl-accepting chemotaxis protein [Bacillus sp. HMF5848]|nr:methyl-accepting chemotaxis protein [Bacillus sp. HMF5848]RSK29153.1 methyl-accepting chemotaxis protein [Bacillus sp. HMF5848]